MTVRIIPRLDIKGPNLVKGIHFEGLRVLGKPETFANHYYRMGADELYFQDAVASLYGRNSLLEIVEKTSSEIFIPLCVGGGLRNIEDVQSVLRAGADKVAINTAAIERPELIDEIAHRFGSSTLVISIEAQRSADGGFSAMVNFGRDDTNLDIFDWALEAADRGAGEIMFTSVDRDGTGIGLDEEMTRQIADLKLSLPVIIGGGCGSAADAVDILANKHAEAVSLASVLHYGVLDEMRRGHNPEAYQTEGNVGFLQTGRSFGKINPTTIAAIREGLDTEGIPRRSFSLDETS